MHLILMLFVFIQNLTAAPCDSARSSIQNMLDNLQNDNWIPEKAALCFEKTEEKSERVQAAKQLKQVLDAQGLFINLKDYPNDPKFTDKNTKQQSVIIHKQLKDISIEKVGDKWIFSKSTFPAISHAYQKTFSSLFSQVLNQLPPWFKTPLLFHIQLWQFLFFVFLLLVSWLIGRIIDRIFINQLVQLANQNKLEVTSQKLILIRKPIMWMCFGLILMYGTPDLKLSVGISRGLLWICKFIITLSVVLLISRLINSFAEIMSSRASKTNSKLDDQLIPLIRRTVQVILWTIGCIFLLQNYGVDVTSLITVGSLATVGIALASKDALENLFGSIVAFVDQPFQIGDWIIIDNSIEGVVEEVGFRSTRIRAFTNSLITVPNAKITRCTVNNFGKRDMRRFKCTLGLRYDTPVEKMEEYLSEVRQTLENNPCIIKEAIYVYLNKMDASSLNIMVYTFFNVPDWRAELAAKEELYLEFMRVAERVGVSFAFPTQTIELENQSPPILNN